MIHSSKTFLDRAGLELNRAERYRIFISLTVMDLSFLSDSMEKEPIEALITSLEKNLAIKVRKSDFCARINKTSIGLLFPETSRQGAEVAINRLTEVVRDEITKISDSDVRQIIPTQLASYPDAAGTVTVEQFLDKLTIARQN